MVKVSPALLFKAGLFFWGWPVLIGKEVIVSEREERRDFSSKNLQSPGDRIVPLHPDKR